MGKLTPKEIVKEVRQFIMEHPLMQGRPSEIRKCIVKREADELAADLALIGTVVERYSIAGTGLVVIRKVQDFSSLV